MPVKHEIEQVEIRRRLGSLITGLRIKGLVILKELYAKDVVSFDIEPPLQHAGIGAKLNNWANVFTVFQELTYELRDLTVVVGCEVAFAHGFGRLGGVFRNGTATDGMWVRTTFCFRKIDGAWLIVHDQVSVPLDIATGKGATGLTP